MMNTKIADFVSKRTDPYFFSTQEDANLTDIHTEVKRSIEGGFNRGGLRPGVHQQRSPCEAPFHRKHGPRAGSVGRYDRDHIRRPHLAIGGNTRRLLSFIDKRGFVHLLNDLTDFWGLICPITTAH